jgi:hypothetical protein
MADVSQDPSMVPSPKITGYPPRASGIAAETGGCYAVHKKEDLVSKRLMGLFIGALVTVGGTVGAEETTTLVVKGVGRTYWDVYKFTDPDTGAICYVSVNNYSSSLPPSISCVRTDQRL